jgi:hypothetical protein
MPRCRSHELNWKTREIDGKDGGLSLPQRCFLGACVERQGCSLQGTFEESRPTPGNTLGGHLIR